MARTPLAAFFNIPMQELTALHPSYKEGQATLQTLLAKCKKKGTTTQYQPLELEKV